MFSTALITQADLLVENLKPGAAQRWDVGLDHDSLQQINPNLVVVRISDYGQDGPRYDRQSTPLTLQAASGLGECSRPRPATCSIRRPYPRVHRGWLRRARRLDGIADR